FSLSTDYYKIDVSDALLQLPSQTIVTNCYNGATDLCQYVIRDPATNVITRVDSLYININNQVLEGVDFETLYRRRVGPGAMTLRLLGTKVLENSQKQPGLARDFLDRDQPKWRVLASVGYTVGPVTANLTERFLSDHLLNRTYVEGINIDNNHVGAY